MTKHNNKKAFSTVELVIVIGVIGILSAILIPTFINLNKQSTYASEQNFVRNINTQLAMKEVDEGKNNLLRDAIRDCKDIGFDILSFRSSDHELMYNEEVDRFYLTNKSDMSIYYPKDAKVAEKQYHTWRFVKNNNLPNSNKNYSYYALNNFASTEVTVGSSFDCGNNWTINTITLDTTGMSLTEERNIKIVTNGFNVVINAPTDDVSHYRYAYTLNVTAVNNSNCFHEYGYVEKFESFGEGKFIAEESAQFKQSRANIEEKLYGKDYELRNSDDNYKIDRYYDEENGEVAERYLEPLEQTRHLDEEYNEPEDYDEPLDDISDLTTRFNFTDATSYTTESHTYFNNIGLRDYFRHYYRNYTQDKISYYTDKAYYSHPIENNQYLEYTNNGYVNIDNNYYKFQLNGNDIASRLNYEVTQANLRLTAEHKKYQADMFTLADIDASYLASKGFKKVGDNKYETTNRDCCNDLISICAPTLDNTGSYMTLNKATIELLDENTMRIRLYADTIQYGKIVDQHLDPAKPNWYMLFSEATIYNVDNTVFSPTENTTIEH